MDWKEQTYGHLAHYGVKGMKWGVRKDKNKGSTKSSIKKLSDDELKARIARLNMERNYAKLLKETGPPPSLASRAASTASEILTTSGKKVASKLIANALERSLTTALNRNSAGGGS